MSVALSSSPAPLSLDAMRTNIANRRRQLRYGMVASPAAFTALMTIIFHLHNSPSVGATLVAVLVFALLFTVATVINTRRSRVELASLDEDDEGSLLATLRNGLDRDISALTLFGWFFPLLGVAINLPAVLASHLPSAAMLLVGALLLAFLPYAVVQRRHLVRERALLRD